MTWNKFLEMVNDNGITDSKPCELTLKILRKFWKKYHKRAELLSIYGAILVSSLIRFEVW